MKYLAAAYSSGKTEGLSDDELFALRQKRFLEITIAAGALMSQGIHVLSPITHGHPIALYSEVALPVDYEFWRDLCRKQIRACDEGLIILMNDGYLESDGVKGDTEYAISLGRTIEFMCPRRMEIVMDASVGSLFAG